MSQHTQPARTSKRQWRRITERATGFVVRPDRLDELLTQPELPRRLYLVGPAPAAGWLRLAQTVPAGWRVEHVFLHGHAPVIHVAHDDGRRVEIEWAAAWLGDSYYRPDEARDAFALMRARLRDAFPGSVLLASPASTGRELFTRTIPFGREYPVLDDELQDLIRATSGGGRIETLAPAAPVLPDLYEYDGRLMYGALAWGLPVGTPRRVRGGLFDPYTPARYLVRVTVPRDWHGRYGLIGVPAGETRAGVYYPHHPGETFTAWCDGAELMLVARSRWSFTIVEHLEWPRYTHAGPLDSWARRLVDVSLDLENRPGRVAALARNGVRAVLLHAIGAFHGATHPVTRMIPVDRADELPESARRDSIRISDGWLTWSEPRGQGWPDLAHPEWSAAIWARARARLLHAPNGGALHVPPDTVVAFRTDAIYLSARADWHDDGRAGRYRLKRHVAGPMAWPRNNVELLRARDGGR